jgi:hypothetical protein
MWQADTPSSIPVPIGYVPWAWSAEADNNSGVWSVNTGSVNVSSNPQIIPNTGDPTTDFPTWSSAVVISAIPCH